MKNKILKGLAVALPILGFTGLNAFAQVAETATPSVSSTITVANTLVSIGWAFVLGLLQSTVVQFGIGISILIGVYMLIRYRRVHP